MKIAVLLLFFSLLCIANANPTTWDGWLEQRQNECNARITGTFTGADLTLVGDRIGTLCIGTNSDCGIYMASPCFHTWGNVHGMDSSGVCNNLASFGNQRYESYGEAQTTATMEIQNRTNDTQAISCNEVCNIDNQTWGTVAGSLASENYAQTRICYDTNVNYFAVESRWNICGENNDGRQLFEYNSVEGYNSGISSIEGALIDMYNAAPCLQNDPDPTDPGTGDGGDPDPQPSSCNWNPPAGNHFYTLQTTGTDPYFCYRVEFLGCNSVAGFNQEYTGGDSSLGPTYQSWRQAAIDGSRDCIDAGEDPNGSGDDGSGDDGSGDDGSGDGSTTDDGEEEGCIGPGGLACEDTLRTFAEDVPEGDKPDMLTEFEDGLSDGGLNSPTQNLEDDLEFQRRMMDRIEIRDETEQDLTDMDGRWEELWNDVKGDFDQLMEDGGDKFPFGIASWIEDAQPTITGDSCPSFVIPMGTLGQTTYSFCENPFDEWLSTVFRTLMLAVLFGIFVLRVVGQIIVTI